jgi:excisionase family DNA binding protein
MSDLQQYIELAKHKKWKAEIEAKAEKQLRNMNLQQLGERKSYWTGIYKENRKMDERSVMAREEASIWLKIIEKSMRKRATEESSEPAPTAEKIYLTVLEAAKLLNISVSTLYKKTSLKEIPHIKLGKKLTFRRADLEKYIADARVRTRSEIDDEAAKFVADSSMKKRKK